ncbi:winged helix-turn-helix domain-containing protein [Lysinibacillus sp. 3P01SB]|uniref:winged helix-turn-helix domain-containing protein n=1 Tax=Lysinibacillus sp. 3P01SB TaxID=3132284 RepID=UPI0039A5535F
MNHTILLIEDDRAISKMVGESLSKEGYTVLSVYDGEEALRLFNEKKNVDLILLDLMLPTIDGLECLRMIRLHSYVPVLIMSAKDEPVDKALGLRLGADDYIAKPFSLIELTARVNALIRRTTSYRKSEATNKDTIKQVGDLVIDLESYSVKKYDQEIKLTAKEFGILRLLVSKPTQAFTKEQLYQLVWQEEYVQDMNVINVHIRRLREKVEDEPSNPKYIKTLWGIGYRLGEL